MLLKNHKLIYFLTLITGLSFPLQVILNDHRIFLIPFVLSLLLFNSKRIKIIINTPLNLSNLFILFLFFYLIIHSILQIIITPTNTLNYVPLILFLYCILLYFYFNILATNLDIDFFLKAIILLGYISTIFFIYDLIYKVIYLEPTFFSKKAQIYQELRSGEEDITSRSIIDYRSAGLFDKAPISTAFVAFSLYFYKIKLDIQKNIFNYIVYLIIFITFFFTLNFTGFVAYLISALFVYISNCELKINLKLIYNFFKTVIFTLFLLLFFNLIINNFLPESYLKIIDFYKDYFFGSNSNIDENAINSFKQTILHTFSDNANIFALLLGDGYPGGYYNSYRKGGDYGFLDNIIGLSILLYFILFYFILYLFVRVNSYQRLNKYKLTKKTNIIKFFLFIIFYIFLNDIHYSIIFFKSIAPFFFITLSILLKLLTKDFKYN
jgi:hypothetical protein